MMPNRSIIRRAIPLSGGFVLIATLLVWLGSLSAPLTPTARALPYAPYTFDFDEPVGSTNFSGVGACTPPACPDIWAMGQYNTSAHFESGDLVRVNPNPTSVTPDSTFAVATWVWVLQGDTFYGNIISFFHDPLGNNQYGARISTGDFVGERFLYVGDESGGVGLTRIASGGWTHVIVSCDNSVCTGYADGVAGTPSTIGRMIVMSNSFDIGGGLQGNLDHMLIYDSPVTDQEAAEIYRAAYLNKTPYFTIVPASSGASEGGGWQNSSSNWVWDDDAGDANIELSISTNYGTITLNGAPPGGITMIVGDFTNKWSFIRMQGPQADLRQALSHLAYDPPDADFDLTANISLTVNDLGNVGYGGPKFASATFQVIYNPINDAPTFSVTNIVVDEDAGLVSPTSIIANPGPWGEQTQSISFPIVSNTNPTLFSTQPSVSVISGSGSRSVAFTPAADLFGAATITIYAQDSGSSGGGQFNTAPQQSFSITVRSVNDVPVFSKGFDPTVNEDAGPQIVPGWATAISAGPANESEQVVSFLVTNSNTALFSEEPAIDGDGTLRYTSAPNAYGTATVTVQARDTGGTANGGQDTSAPQSFLLTVLPVNDAPVNHLPPDGLEVVQNRPVYLSGIEAIALEDVDVGSEPLNVTLSAENGVLSLALISGLRFSSGDAIEDTAISFSGDLASVNAALASMDFFPNQDYLGPASLSITVSDQGAYGQGGPLEDSDTLNLVVNRANQAPALQFPATTIANPSNPDPIGIPLDGPASVYPSSIPVFGINGAVRKISVTLHGLSHTFPADLDVLLLAPSGKAVLLMSDVAGSMDLNDVTLTFDDQAIAGLPISPRSVRSGSYRPTNYSIGVADSFPAPAPPGPYAGALGALAGDDPNGFWRLLIVDDYRDTDAGNLAGGWSLRIAADGRPYTSEGQDLVFSSAGENPITLDDPDAGASPVALSLEASAGTLTLGRTSGLSFYSGDGSADQSMSFSGSITALNAALEGLRYSAPTYSNLPARIRFVLDDQGYDGAGGAQVLTETLAIFVNPSIDSAPSIAAIATNEDTLSGAIGVGPGPNDGAEVVAFQISAIAGGQLFLADATTRLLDGDFITAAQGAAGLRFMPETNANANGSFRAQGTLSDNALGLGGPASTTTITVTPVNDSPTLASLSDVVLPESPGEQSVDLAGIGSGAPNENDTLSISATSSDTNVIPDPIVDYSSPAASGRLRLTSLGQVGSATITVRVLDDGAPPRSIERSFVVVVGRLNELPLIDTIDNLTIDEDSGATNINLAGIGAGDNNQSLALTATSSDPAILPDPQVSYTSPQASGSLGITPLPNAHGSVTITVSLLDDGHPPLRAETRFVVEVRQINDAPSFVKGLNETLDSNAGAYSVQLWATRIDPGPQEATQQVHFELAVDHPELFSVQPAVSSAGTLSFTPQRNVEGVALVSVVVVDDGGTENGGQDRSAAQSFRIILLKDNLPPAFRLSPGSITLDEDFAGERAVIVTPDPVPESERGQVVNYRLSPPEVGFANVTINPRTGNVTITARQDGFGQQRFTLIASDGQVRNHTARQEFTLTVNPLNDPPALDPIDSLAIVEDSEPRVLALSGISAGPFSEAQQLSVTAISSNRVIMADPTVSYTSPDGVGSLALAPLPEQNGAVIITVRVTDDGDPARMVERRFQVTVIAQNDAPTINTPLVFYADPGSDTPLRRIVIADKDSGPQPVVVTLRVSSGRLTVAESVRRGVTAAQISGNRSAKVVLTAPIEAIQTTLADRYGLRYQARSGFIGPDPLRIEVNDQGHTGGDALSEQVSVPLNVEPLADLDLGVQMRELPRSGAALAGTGITREYSVELANNGPSTATGVILFAQVPTGARLARIDAGAARCSGSVAISCTVGTIAVMGRVRLAFVIADAPQTGTIEDLRFQIQADQVDPSTLGGGEEGGNQRYLPFVRR